MESADGREDDFWADSRRSSRRTRAGPTPPPVRRGPGAGLASVFLAGLTTMEVIALVVGAVAVTGLLWATGTLAPERLATDPWLRSAWVALVLGLLRPVTWVPYLIPYLTFRRLAGSLQERAQWVRPAVAHVLTLGLLSGVLWLIVATVEGAGRAILSALAFASGSGDLDTLGSFRGDWTAARIAGIVAGAVLLRVVVPPLGPDLDLSTEPVLGFPSGRRGAFDRVLVLVFVAVGVAVGGLAALLAGRS